jgi:hypothetical protein
MKALTYFQFKHFVVLFLMLYGLLFFLEPTKAKEVFWGTVERMNVVVEWGQNLFDSLFIPSSKEEQLFEEQEQKAPAPSGSPPSLPQKQQPSPPVVIPENERQWGA